MPKSPADPTPPEAPAAKADADEDIIQGGEYIAELESQIGTLTGQVIQSRMIIRKLQGKLSGKVVPDGD